MAHYAFLNINESTLELEKQLNIYVDEQDLLKEITDKTQEQLDRISELDLLINELSEQIKIPTKGIVSKVIVGVSEFKNIDTSEIDEVDHTEDWEKYYQKSGYGICKRTSYNTVGGVHQNGGTPFRKNYAGVGYTYDFVRDAFYAPQPFESWTLNEDTCLWEAPVEKPEGEYWWKEDTGEWVDYEYYSEPIYSNSPFASWTWNTSTGVYDPPVAKPADKNLWHEGEQQWTTTSVVSEKPYPSWVLADSVQQEYTDEEGNLKQLIVTDWAAPVEKPNDGNSYLWDEETQTWIAE